MTALPGPARLARHARRQLIDFIERDVRPGWPVVLVGHSSAGLLSLLVACRRPELGNTSSCSTLRRRWLACGILAWSQLTGLVHRVPPAAIAAKAPPKLARPRGRASPFSSKPMFARWDPRVLDDYLACGFEERGGEVRLRFEREVESRIYATLPAYVPRLLKRHPPRCTIDFFGGTQSRRGTAPGRPRGQPRPCRRAIPLGRAATFPLREAR